MRRYFVGRERGSIGSTLPAGVVDAAFASLATFLAGLVAVNVYEADELGIYAVFFVAFTFGQLVAYQLVYVPAEIVAVSRKGAQRLTIVPDSLRIGLLPTIAGASIVFASAITTAPLAPLELTVGLTVSAWIATWLSPTQDHVRRTLHISGHSWHAATMSITQFVVCGAALGVMLLIDVPLPWVPFGALAAANLASLTLGLVFLRRDRAGETAPARLGFRDISAKGWWLLLQASIPAAAAFVTANIITYLASPEAMGHAEAARIVAQPIAVLAAGLIYPLRPHAMEAALTRNLARSVRVERLYVAIVLLGGLLYIPFAGFVAPWNPMRILVPAAYEVPGLVIVTILANVILASVFLGVNEMMAAGKGRTLAVLNGMAAPVRIALSTSAAAIGAYARPLSEGLAEFVVVGGVARAHRRLYREPEAVTAPSEAVSGS